MSGTWQPRDRRGPKKPDDPIRDNIVSNERIRHIEVRVVDEHGAQLGVMPTRTALKLAKDSGLDLIEVTADAKPPVVKIVDLGKWVYSLKRAKKEQERKTRENATIIKEIQLRPVTDKHDIEVKQNHAKEFLADNAKVKIVIKFKGRELNFAQKGFEVMNTFITGLGDCKIEKEPEMNGRMLMAIIAPHAAIKKA